MRKLSLELRVRESKMKKLLIFAAILSFCTTETYGGLGDILNAATTVAQQLTPNGMMQQNMGINGTQQQMYGNQYPYGAQVTTMAQQNAGNFLNGAATGIQQYGNQAATGIQQYGNRALNFTGNLHQNAGNFLNNMATTAQQYSNQMQYNAGMMGTQVNSATILTILNKMITLATEIRNNYGAQYLQISTWSQTLIGTLTMCLDLNKFSVLQLLAILKYTTQVCKILDTVNEQARTASQDLWELFYELSAAAFG